MTVGKGYRKDMEDFFRELEDALRGEVSEYEYRDSITYYRDYFREQMASGKSEDEIAAELGISEAAVYKHLAQGITKLREKFNEN